METNPQMAHWRTQLLSLLSHEVRTPLTTIIAFAQTLQADDEDITEEEQRHYLSIIERESKRISQFLGELIEISNFESTPEYLNVAQTDYSHLVKSVVKEYKETSECNIELKIPDTRVLARIDERRIQDALHVLLSYMSHNYKGLIEISVTFKDCSLLTTIKRPSGMINEREVREIFDINRQLLLTKASKSIKEAPVYGAVIIRAHQGQIKVQSSMSAGLTISFELPRY